MFKKSALSYPVLDKFLNIEKHGYDSENSYTVATLKIPIVHIWIVFPKSKDNRKTKLTVLLYYIIFKKKKSTF